MASIFEYRGVDNPVYAKITKDDSEGFTTGVVKDFAGVSQISKSTSSSSETHFYNNVPAIVIESQGSDEITINASGIPFDILAEITGQYYDATTGMFVEQERTPGYFAFGYRTQKTDGTDVYVWRLKGTFSIPDSSHNTQNDSTDANGQELTFTGISTTHKFTKTNKPAKAVNVDTSVNTVDVTDFFDSVQTPDTIQPVTPPSVTGIGVTPSSASVVEGGSVQLTATLYPAGASGVITWTTSDDTYASVDQTGKVSGLAAGSATVTATCGTYTDTCTVTVTAAPEP